jgi:hypothetical protein
MVGIYNQNQSVNKIENGYNNCGKCFFIFKNKKKRFNEI